jgi:hypothetical protein
VMVLKTLETLGPMRHARSRARRACCSPSLA